MTNIQELTLAITGLLIILTICFWGLAEAIKPRPSEFFYLNLWGMELKYERGTGR